MALALLEQLWKIHRCIQMLHFLAILDYEEKLDFCDTIRSQIRLIFYAPDFRYWEKGRMHAVVTERQSCKVYQQQYFFEVTFSSGLMKLISPLGVILLKSF